MKVVYGEKHNAAHMAAITDFEKFAPPVLQREFLAATSDGERLVVAHKAKALCNARFAFDYSARSTQGRKIQDLIGGVAGVYLSEEGFADMFSGIVVANPEANGPRQARGTIPPATLNITEVWAAEQTGPDDQISGSVFRPDLAVPICINPDSGLPAMNAFKPPRHAHLRAAGLLKPEQGDIGPIMRYLEALVPAQAEREHLIAMIGFKLLHPAAVLPMVLFMCEQQGSGRDTFFSYVSALFGPSNVALELPTSVFEPGDGSKFNAYRASYLIGCVSEGTKSSAPRSAREDSHREEVGATLRSLINPGLLRFAQVQDKNIRMAERLVPIWFFMASNNPVPVTIEPSDRRVFAIDNGVASIEAQAELFASMRDGRDLAAFAAYAEARALSEEDAFRLIPFNAAKARLVEGNVSDADAALADVLASRTLLPSPVATVGQIQSAYILHSMLEQEGMPSLQLLKHITKKAKALLRGADCPAPSSNRTSRVAVWPLPAWVQIPLELRPLLSVNLTGMMPLRREERPEVIEVFKGTVNGKRHPKLDAWLDANDVALRRVSASAEDDVQAAMNASGGVVSPLPRRVVP